MSRKVLIVDDEQGIRQALGQLLEFEGYEVRSADNATDGITQYQSFRPHLVFLDVKMAGIDGLEALKRLREIDPSAVVVMISGHATIQTAVEATQRGAYDILEKPLDTDRILVTLRNALSHLDLYEENTRLRQTIESRFELVRRSYAIRAVSDEIGDMSCSANGGELRVLQGGMVTRIGGSEAVDVAVRVRAATNKRVEDEIPEGRFGEDLYYRLDVVPLRVPPLRERREDVPLL